MDSEELFDSQITTVVYGFMQVWNRFESALPGELVRIQGNLGGMQPQKGHHPSSNYELFYRACSSIYPDGSITMGEFSNALSAPLSTATRIADWLVESNYIQRIPDSEDRRVVRVSLTGTGKELFQSIDHYIRQRMQQIMSSLTPEERTTLLTLINKLLTGFKEVIK